MICKKCGGEMVPAVEGSVQGLKCSLCGEWSYMTTYISDIKTDKTIYSICLQTGNSTTIQTIKNVAAVSKCNFIEAKELLGKANQIIFEGTAEKTLEAANFLKSVGIKYTISPDFQYDK